MLTLNDGRNELWQWDTNRKLSVDVDCSQVHFSNKVFGRSIDVEVVGGVAIIPDILLQTDKELIAWAFVGTAENGYTKISKVFKVNKRNKPADYVFTPVEQMTIQEIEAIAQSVRDDADAGLFNGENGISVTHEWKGTVLNVTSASGTTSADLKGSTGEAGPRGPRGEKGEKGDPGAIQTVNGQSPDEHGNVEVQTSAQSDWNAAEGEAGHVLNRTHWTERKLTELLPETKLTYNENVGNMVFPEEFPFQVKQTYTVFYNGAPYTCTCYELEMQGVRLVGVGNGKDFGLPDTGEPFCMGNVPMMPGMTMVIDYGGATACTVRICQEGETVHQLDSKYIKDMYSETRQPGSITFDGDITDRYIASNIFGYKMVKVSDDILTAQQLQHATITMVDVTAGITLTKTVAQWATEVNMTLEEYVTTDETTGVITLHSGMVAVATTYYSNENVAWQPGTYFLYVKLSELGTTTHAYTSELTYEDAKVTQIHPKYIPQMYYEETAGMVQLLPETSPAYNESEGMFELTGLPALEVDRTYAVTYNGTAYTCRSYLYQGLTFLGSRMIQTGTPDAYPFVIASGTLDGMPFSRLADINGATECTVAIAAESTLIHKIPAKYMPDLPYFDLTAMGLPRFNWSGSTVSADADCSAIIAALEKGPVKLRWQTAINGKLWEFAGVVTGVKNSVHGSYNATFLTVLEDAGLGGTTPIVHNFHFSATHMTGQLVPLTTKELTQ